MRLPADPLRQFVWSMLMMAALTLFLLPSGSSAASIPGFFLEGEHWTYSEGDLKFEGVLLKPPGNGPFPAVVISHGLGGNAQGFGRELAKRFLTWGMVCIAPDYTHSEAARRGVGAVEPGGRRGQQAPDFGASRENISRASKCVEVLENLPYVDGKRIAAYGHSMGAFVTVGLAAQVQERLKAAAITAGGLSGRPGFPAPTHEVAERIRTPFCVLHGSLDTTVRPEQSQDLVTIMEGNKVPVSRYVFDGVNHDVHRAKADECFRLIRDWFTQYGVLDGSALR
jgi:dienelactone hydrolase